MRSEVFDFVQRHALDQFGHDGASGLADGAAFAFEAGLDHLVVLNFEVDGDQVAAPGISATELHGGILHAVAIAGILEVVKDVIDVFLAVHNVS